MQAIAFYLTYPFILLVSLLPFPVMYFVSDILFVILYLSGYRKKVVKTNLRRSFPEKSEQEITRITRNYYRYLCDLTLETFKTLTWSEKEAKKRCIFHTKPFLDEMYKAKQSFIIVMGHYGNWEWSGPAFTLNLPFQLVVIYRPLSNPYFDRMLTKGRTKFGTKITPVKSTLRDMVANRHEIRATALVADQTATKKDAYWTTFLNQETAVFTGPEKLAKKFEYPVVFMRTRRPRRGYYEITPELMFSDPKATAENEITVAFTKRIEKDIVEDPTFWLWSHRRWKHKRPVEVTTH